MKDKLKNLIENTFMFILIFLFVLLMFVFLAYEIWSKIMQFKNYDAYKEGYSKGLEKSFFSSEDEQAFIEQIKDIALDEIKFDHSYKDCEDLYYSVYEEAYWEGYKDGLEREWE